MASSSELIEKLKNEAAQNAIPQKEVDLFAGPYERLIDRKFIADPNYKDTKILPTENFSSKIVPKRKFQYKILITRPKREFEAPINNFLADRNAGDETVIANTEVKGVKSTNEYPLIDRATIEMGFQTANEVTEKVFQVKKKTYVNQYNNTFEQDKEFIEKKFLEKKNKYLGNPNILMNIENFLNKVKPRMEEALQSNETINIFMTGGTFKWLERNWLLSNRRQKHARSRNSWEKDIRWKPRRAMSATCPSHSWALMSGMTLK